MPQVSPVFSVDPAARRVYHDNSLCAERYHIAPRDKRPPARATGRTARTWSRGAAIA